MRTIGALVSDDSGWVVDYDLPEDDDPRNGLHARARRIRTAGSADSSLDYALKLLFDPLADPAERRASSCARTCPGTWSSAPPRSSEPGVRAFAVGLERTPMEIVVTASTDEAWQVRVEAARRRGCPPEVLERLARDRDAIVRRGALATPVSHHEFSSMSCSTGDRAWTPRWRRATADSG